MIHFCLVFDVILEGVEAEASLNNPEGSYNNTSLNQENLSESHPSYDRILNEDMLSEIFSRCSMREIAKFRLLNKECNKRSYELNFLDCHIHRTNSVFGYFVVQNKDIWDQYRCPYFIFGIKEEDETQISIEFIPSYIEKIRAWDTHHGILLCVYEYKYKGHQIIPDYIVCKPATKEYRIIPNPKTRYFTEAIGLMVVSSSPLRYKIIRVSQPKRWVTKEGLSKYNCELFDSDLFKWQRVNDLILPSCFPRINKPVSAYGCLHWLRCDNNVTRFCMQTETWSIFKIPNELLDKHSLILISYEGKLGVIQSYLKGGTDIWVLEKSFGKNWVKVEDAKLTVLNDYVQPFWFASNDAVSVATSFRLGLYNMNNNRCEYLQTNNWFGYLPTDNLIPFYSNYDMVGLNKRCRRVT